jgi:5-methyltetrahydropteroyltriglutamate--homocysteine methyltransferase
VKSVIATGPGGLILASAGSYPRSGEAPEHQVLPQTITLIRKGERTAADLDDAENTVTRQAIAEQVRAGMEMLTDGLVRGRDPVSHIAGKYEGVVFRHSRPFLSSGRTYRQPVVQGKLRRKPTAPSLAQEFRYACNSLGLLQISDERSGRMGMKPVLLGPYTLAFCSEGDTPALERMEARARVFAEALAGEITELADAGATLIQVDEPAILERPEDWVVFAEGIFRLIGARDAARKAGKPVQVALYTYYGDATPLFEQLIRLPVDALGLDFSGNGSLAERVAAGSPIPLALGLVDGRSHDLEDAAAVARLAERLLSRIEEGRAFLGPSCGLEHLPRPRAYEKLELLARIREHVAGKEQAARR